MLRQFLIRLIQFCFKDKIIYLIRFKYRNTFKKYDEDKKIFYLLTPIHGNMGDQAIAYATTLYFKEKYSEYKVIEVYREDVDKLLLAIKRSLQKDDLIFLHGGGNMGNLYLEEEESRRNVINYFKKHTIISMTQTMMFTQDEDGEREKQISIDIYNKHPKLKLIAREEKSLQIMKSSFSNVQIIKNPDIVFYLAKNFKQDCSTRTRIMTCLRGDKESVLGKNKELLLDYLEENFENLIISDTVINQEVTLENRELLLTDMFNRFKSAKVVITDRLHGMVFCAITRTPCIVTSSFDHKVLGTYEWIKDLNYIIFVNDLRCDNIKSKINELLEIETFSDMTYLEEYFNTLKGRLLV